MLRTLGHGFPFNRLARSLVSRPFSMDAFLEFERELARKKRSDSPPKPPRTQRLEPPRKPDDGDCCNLNCPNCVLLIYNEQLLEYEDSVRWANASSTSSNLPIQMPKDLDIALEWAPSGLDIQLSSLPAGAKPFEILKNERLCHSPTRSVHHLGIDVAPEEYATASNLSVNMSNDDDIVKRCVTFLGIDDTSVVKVNHPTKYPKDQWLTLSTLLKWHVDLTSPPRPRILRMLSAYATNTSDATNILELAQSDDVSFSLIEILEQHSSLKLTLDAFLDLAPALVARNYTIASSFLHEKSSLSLAVAVKPQGRCSVYLASRDTLAKDSIVASFSQSSFSIQWNQVLSSNNPLLFIGTGTGIAPFRGMLQDLSYQTQQRRKVALFYGCRDPSHDFLFEVDLKDAMNNGALTKIYPAFSGGESPQYVQHRLEEEAELVCSYIIEKNGSVFVCGSLAMGRDVKHALIECFISQLKWSNQQAKSYLAQMQEEKRYVAEVW